MLAIIIIVALFGAGFLFQRVGDFLDARRYPAPGRLIEVPGGAKLHVFARGNAQGPAVVFEAGISGSCLSWSTVQPLVAQFAQAVVYDRAGLGWSAGKLTQRTVAQMVSELAAALDAAQIVKPYVLVGHSFGGLLVQAFAHSYPERTAAVVMVDPVSQREWAQADARQMNRLNMGARLSRRGALLARFGVVRAALSLLVLGGTRIPRMLARVSAGQGNSVIERLITEVRKLPPEAQPMVGAQWSKARSFTAMAAYLECLPPSASAAMSMPMPKEIPLVILSAENATEEEWAERDAWVAANGDGRHIKVARSGHWLQLDRPELVASTVREILIQVR